MRSNRCLILAVALALISPALRAADAITSSAPPLPDLGNLQMDMTLPGLDLPELGAPAGATPDSTAAQPAPAAAAPTSVPAAPEATATFTPTTAPAQAAPAADTPTTTPTAVSPAAVPASPTETVAVPTAVPTATTAVTETAATPVATQAETPAAAPLKGLEAYFPMRTGMKWTYTSKTGKTRIVECVSREAQGGAVVGSFHIATTEASLSQSWKLSGGKIVLASKIANLKIGWVRLVEPQGKTIPRWVYDQGNGTGSYYKQEVGAVTPSGKKYADGLTVTERTLNAGKQLSLRKWFYAKGVGLVAEAAYDTDNNPLPDQTFELEAQ